MIRFGMANTMITFSQKYWEYGGSDMEKKGLTIGGFESIFLADPVTAFILENSEDLFGNSIYSKIYRNNGIKVDLGIQTTDKICDWFEIFQTRLNNVTGSDSLKFTMEIWDPKSPPNKKPRNEKVKIIREEALPYLDLEIYLRDDALKFRVHLNPIKSSNTSTKVVPIPSLASEQYQMVFYDTSHLPLL